MRQFAEIYKIVFVIILAIGVDGSIIAIGLGILPAVIALISIIIASGPIALLFLISQTLDQIAETLSKDKLHATHKDDK